MTDFDPVKAQSEELTGLVDMLKLVSTRARESERQLAEIEADHNALLKLEGFTKGLVEHARIRLQHLKDEAEKGGA